MSTVNSRSGRLSRSYIIRYSLLFLGISVFVFLPFIRYSRSFVNKVDGMPQYIVYLRYMGQYLRLCAKNILHGNLSLPLYDFSIGMGDDIGQIVRFHPLDFLSALVPSACTEQLYAVILLLRFYLAGLAFSLFAFYWNTVPLTGESEPEEIVYPPNVLSGALVYVFSGFMLIRVMNHPIYAAPFIVLPLLLLGAEKVMRRQGSALFVFSVFLGFWSNYYFMYIMAAAPFVYMLVRYFDVVRPLGIRTFSVLFFRMTGLFILGLAMSAMTLLPTMHRYLSSARQSMTSETFNMLIYEDRRRYAAWFLNLITPFKSSGNGTDLNFAVIVLPCLAVLFFCRKKRFRSLRKFLIADLVMLLVPFFGYVLAVFNNENNRWMFLIALCLGMTVVFTADSFASLTRRQVLAVTGAAVLFLAAAACQCVLGGMDVFHAAAAIQLILCTGVLLACSMRKVPVKKVRLAVLGITCISVAVNGYMTYSPGFGAVADDYVPAGKTTGSYDSYWRSKGAALTEQDESFFRVEGYGVKHGRENSAQYSDYNSTSEYNSILNAYMLSAMLSQNHIGQDAVTILKGLDARPVSMNLAHVKYFIARQKDSGSVPYGYGKEPAGAVGKVRVYENECPLAFGYSCGAFITRDSFDALTPLEREMVQLDAVVLPGSDMGGEQLADELREAGLREVKRPSCRPESVRLSLEEEGDGYTWKDGMLSVNKGALIDLEYEKREGCDAYLQLEGLRFDGQSASLWVWGEDYSVKTLIRGSTQVYNIGREDYLFHLGYAEENAAARLSLKFRGGSYELGGASVVYVPMDGYEEKIAALNEDSLLDEHVTDGRAEGRVSLAEPKIMVFSVPAAKGWELRVDGVKTDIITANLMYQGVLLQAGDHEIELTYHTPGLTAGICVAVPALVLWAVLALYEHRRRRAGRRDEEEKTQRRIADA